MALVALAALASCGRKPAPPPTPDELGAEIATFSQFLMPLSTGTLQSIRDASGRKGDSVTAADFNVSYELGSIAVNGRAAGVLVAYSNPWLAPAGAMTQPVSAAQLFRALEAERDAAAAVLITPKGQIFITRDQLPDIRAKLFAMNIPDKDLPFEIIRGARR